VKRTPVQPQLDVARLAKTRENLGAEYARPDIV
jgi:hypothetical protein